MQFLCQQTQLNIKKAADSILSGKVVGFPTETVYGLGANAFNEQAVRSIFKAKGRPNDNPLIKLPRTYELLINEFWPGPLTILIKSPSQIPAETTANLNTVGVRIPYHPIARALIECSGVPLAAPSANSSGKPSTTTALHVYEDIFQRKEAREVMDYIIDGGRSDIGLESTVIDGITVDGKVRVLRPGGVTVEDLKRVVGDDNVVYEKMEIKTADFKPTTPGMKYKHYSPKARVLLLMNDSNTNKSDKIKKLKELIESLDTNDKIGMMTLEDSLMTNELMNINKSSNNLIPYFIGPSNNPSIVASNIFAGLHSLDKHQVEYILVEGVEERNEGLAIMNRLYKAAGNLENVILI
ncbi:hypothetical protein E3P92_02107 [Wallemia ichthyophaga]|uniref:Threonylcarbamoyl-AMP synthase n=1 Tax=Wallemia ichthyophaga TaxID=245174 RepID=A0A4T0KA75_WALIC|nr:hypothetical protein E3P91_02103 [Wallemia ichthyophaga]TIA81908.1 hypothetical protein E3P98_01770 [Wallemia ichthyophaga]TIA90987.1 hypothetical protein E3P97_02216 [Wallemia ichthyophaga]TIA99966.1 hypothetical protein E3P95_01841 [Wallemia ichthyophaga]TIB01270.1 hypothetical protein E3P94_01873 [Wallemia ichthyophaga]